MMTVDLFIPCFIDQLYPQTGVNTLKILRKLNLDVHYNPDQTCCGQPSFNSGYWEDTRILAKKFLRDFPHDRPVITPSASCAGFVKKCYPELFQGTHFMSDYERVNKNLFELTDFLVNHLHVKSLGAEFNAKVTYHDSCSALREYGIKNEPRTLLNHVKGLTLVEMKESETCCGFGGTFSIKYEAVSSAMVEQKIRNAMETGAEYIVTTEASCMLNMEGYIKKHQLPLKTIHIADILSSGWQ